MTQTSHRDRDELDAGVDDVRASPRDDGDVVLIVRRPGTGEREVVPEACLEPLEGLVGDDWKRRGSRRTADGRADPRMQLTLMNARAAALIAGTRSRWPLAGDQLYVDLDLSQANLPDGTRLAVGEALIEITDEPHLGCGKFAERFGRAAMQFVNSELGRRLRLRGVNARILSGGRVRTNDRLRIAGVARAPVLVSERLRLRPVTGADTARLLAHWSRTEVGRWLWDGQLPPPAAVESIVASSLASAADDGVCLYIVTPKDADDFLGVCGIRRGPRGAELIYSLEPDHWHRGHAFEASRIVLDHCFRTLGLAHMDACVDEPNVESIRVLERLGFRETSREHVNGLPQRFFRLQSK